MHLVKKNKKIKIEHYRFAYINNTKIIKTSKLLTNIENFKKEKNFTKIYSNFK